MLLCLPICRRIFYRHTTRTRELQAYDRRLSDAENESARVGRKLQKWKNNRKGRKLAAAEQSE